MVTSIHNFGTQVLSVIPYKCAIEQDINKGHPHQL